MSTNRPITLLIYVGLFLSALVSTGLGDTLSPASPSSATILCYLNGDNNLAPEVLHALDMMETVGSSDTINVVALVDSHPRWLAPYSAEWSRTRLLHLKTDPQIGRIASPVIEDWGEADLGAPETLERFVRTALQRFPAERYIFYAFVHGQGVIDTRCYESPPTAKTVSFSRDDTSGRQLTLDQFHQALKSGLDGRRFDLMVLFSCLANMVEVGYTLSDVTRLLIGSQDEIRLVNQPPGRFQIRGLHFESFIAALMEEPDAEFSALSRGLVDSHVESYERDVILEAGIGEGRTCRYAGDMALLDTAAMPQLGEALDQLARDLIRYQMDPQVVQAMQAALSTAQSFASFLNLEYYDLQGFLNHLREGLPNAELTASCDRVLNLLKKRVLIYARRSAGCSASGISIYLSHPLVPENIFQAHQALYRANAFSRNTHWDEMIHVFRARLREAMDPAKGRHKP